MKRLIFFLFALLFLISPSPLAAETDSERYNQVQKDIQEIEGKLKDLGQKKQSLANEIAIMDSKIRLAALKIEQTENSINRLQNQIGELTDKIDRLDTSLNNMSFVFLNRVVASYKSQERSPLTLFFSSKTFADFYRQWGYLKILQLNDRKIMVAMEEARSSYDRQKQDRQEKQEELQKLKDTLDSQKAALEKQKKDKKYLLIVTQNDEKIYQEKLAQALAELQAIQAIVAGKGDEKEIGGVNMGDKIATVIEGKSACSTGTHLHFEIHDGDTVVDPTGYLSNPSIVWDNAPDGAFSFGGSWRWPIQTPARITQGYGMTFYARVLRYYGGNPHTGIDMASEGGMADVYAVQNGTLYNGSIKCGSGYLRYVRVKHKDSNFSSYYLHINYGRI